MSGSTVAGGAVLVVADGIGTAGGGPPGYTRSLRAGLERIDHGMDLDFFDAAPPPPSASGSRWRALGRRLRRIGARWAVRAVPGLAEAIDGHEVLVLQGYQPAVRARRARQRGAAVVYMPHSPAVKADEDRMVAEGRGQRLSRRLEHRAVRNERALVALADRVVLPALEAAAPYLEAFRDQSIAQKVHYLPSGVFDVADLVERGPSRIPADSPRPVVLFAGRYVGHKGYDLYLRAAERLAGRGAAFYTLGGPPGEQSEAVQDLGTTSTPWATIAAADLVVSANRVAYFDLLPLEAAALGRGLVMTAVGGNVVQLAALPDAVACTPADLVTGIEEALRRLRTDPDWGRANRAAYVERFTDIAMAERWVVFLRSLLEARRGGTA